MMVWNFPRTAVGPSSTSMSLLSVTMTGELLWPRLRACASSRLSSSVAGEDARTDWGPERELCPGRENHRGEPGSESGSTAIAGPGAAVFLSDLLIRAAARRAAQNNHVLRGVSMAKDAVIIKSSSLYRNRQTKTLENGGRELRKLRCHTLIKLHLLAKHHNDSDGFFSLSSLGLHILSIQQLDARFQSKPRSLLSPRQEKSTSKDLEKACT